jgi:hypothetical protein
MINAGHKGHEETPSPQRISLCDRSANLVSIVTLHFISRWLLQNACCKISLSEHQSFAIIPGDFI